MSEFGLVSSRADERIKRSLLFALWLLILYKLATRMANSSERALPPMDLSGSAAKVVERWRQWKRSYEYYIDGKGITQARRKKSQLLHLAGLEVQDIFEDLVNPGPVNSTTDDMYKVCIRKLDAHFRANDNVPYEQHMFCHMAPLSGESADKFFVRLKKTGKT